jgi:hypothetical protein
MPLGSYFFSFHKEMGHRRPLFSCLMSLSVYEIGRSVEWVLLRKYAVRYAIQRCQIFILLTLMYSLANIPGVFSNAVKAILFGSRKKVCGNFEQKRNKCVFRNAVCIKFSLYSSYTSTHHLFGMIKCDSRFSLFLLALVLERICISSIPQ